MGEGPLQRHSIVAWARRVGMTPRRARYAVSKGEIHRLQLPPGARLERTPAGRTDVLVPWGWPQAERRAVALYARSWWRGEPAALMRQLAALEEWARKAEVEVLATVQETAGPFDFPQRLLDLVIDPTILVIVVANKQALGWLNAPFLTAILESQGRDLLDLGLVDAGEHEEWAALLGVQRLGRQLLRDLHQVLRAHLPAPRDPPPPLAASPPP